MNWNARWRSATTNLRYAGAVVPVQAQADLAAMLATTWNARMTPCATSSAPPAPLPAARPVRMRAGDGDHRLWVRTGHTPHWHAELTQARRGHSDESFAHVRRKSKCEVTHTSKLHIVIYYSKYISTWQPRFHLMLKSWKMKERGNIIHFPWTILWKPIGKKGINLAKSYCALI